MEITPGDHQTREPRNDGSSPSGKNKARYQQGKHEFQALL